MADTQFMGYRGGFVVCNGDENLWFNYTVPSGSPMRIQRDAATVFEIGNTGSLNLTTTDTAQTSLSIYATPSGTDTPRPLITLDDGGYTGGAAILSANVNSDNEQFQFLLDVYPVADGKPAFVLNNKIGVDSPTGDLFSFGHSNLAGVYQEKLRCSAQGLLELSNGLIWKSTVSGTIGSATTLNICPTNVYAQTAVQVFGGTELNLNEIKLGSNTVGQEGIRTITAQEGGMADKPALRYNYGLSRWEFRNTGTSFSQVGTGNSSTWDDVYAADSDGLSVNVTAKPFAITQVSPSLTGSAFTVSRALAAANTTAPIVVVTNTGASDNENVVQINTSSVETGNATLGWGLYINETATASKGLAIRAAPSATAGNTQLLISDNGTERLGIQTNGVTRITCSETGSIALQITQPSDSTSQILSANGTISQNFSVTSNTNPNKVAHDITLTRSGVSTSGTLKGGYFLLQSGGNLDNAASGYIGLDLNYTLNSSPAEAYGLMVNPNYRVGTFYSSTRTTMSTWTSVDKSAIVINATDYNTVDSYGIVFTPPATRPSTVLAGGKAAVFVATNAWDYGLYSLSKAQVANIELGPTGATDKTITALQAATSPAIRYLSSGSKWQYSNDGSAWNDFFGTSSLTWDAIYANDKTLTIDSTAVVITQTSTTGSSFTYSRDVNISGTAGANPLLKVTDGYQSGNSYEDAVRIFNHNAGGGAGDNSGGYGLAVRPQRASSLGIGAVIDSTSTTGNGQAMFCTYSIPLGYETWKVDWCGRHRLQVPRDYYLNDTALYITHAPVFASSPSTTYAIKVDSWDKGEVAFRVNPSGAVRSHVHGAGWTNLVLTNTADASGWYIWCDSTTNGNGDVFSMHRSGKTTLQAISGLDDAIFKITPISNNFTYPSLTTNGLVSESGSNLGAIQVVRTGHTSAITGTYNELVAKFTTGGITGGGGGSVSGLKIDMANSASDNGGNVAFYGVYNKFTRSTPSGGTHTAYGTYANSDWDYGLYSSSKCYITTAASAAALDVRNTNATPNFADAISFNGSMDGGYTITADANPYTLVTFSINDTNGQTGTGHQAVVASIGGGAGDEDYISHYMFHASANRGSSGASFYGFWADNKLDFGAFSDAQRNMFRRGASDFTSSTYATLEVINSNSSNTANGVLAQISNNSGSQNPGTHFCVALHNAAQTTAGTRSTANHIGFTNARTIKRVVPMSVGMPDQNNAKSSNTWNNCDYVYIGYDSSKNATPFDYWVTEDSTANRFLTFPISLPDGCTITSVVVNQRGNGGGAAATNWPGIELCSKDTSGSTTGTVIASQAASSSGLAGASTITLSLSTVIDNSTNSYWVRYYNNDTAGTLWSYVYWMTITYTIQDLGAAPGW